MFFCEFKKILPLKKSLLWDSAYKSNFNQQLLDNSVFLLQKPSFEKSYQTHKNLGRRPGRKWYNFAVRKKTAPNITRKNHIGNHVAFGKGIKYKRRISYHTRSRI